MRPFDEYYEEFSKTKKKNLQNFIDIARKIHRGEISFNQHKNVKKSNQNFIGVKRQRNDTTNNNNDIVGIIDDFIYTKRRIMNENEFEERVNFIKDKLNELIKEGIQMLNNNAFNAIVRLMRFMSCSRNFSNDTIKQSKIIEEVKEKMKSIIIMKLFDSSRIENELTEYETISSNELIAQIDSNEEYNSKESIKESQSVSESSMILSSGSKTDYEDLKTKIKIFPVDGNGLYNILQSICEIDNKDIKDNDDTAIKDARNNGGFTPRKELDDQPVLNGYLGPMWNGVKDNQAHIRYETQDVYDMMSETKNIVEESSNAISREQELNQLLDLHVNTDIDKQSMYNYFNEVQMNNEFDEETYTTWLNNMLETNFEDIFEYLLNKDDELETELEDIYAEPVEESKSVKTETVNSIDNIRPDAKKAMQKLLATIEPNADGNEYKLQQAAMTVIDLLDKE